MNASPSVDSIDVAFEAIQRLLKELPAFESTLNSEADVRLKIVDTMLSDVLGWTKAEMQTEESAGTGFLDYKLSVNGIARVVVEAKRAERVFDLGGRECGFPYKLSGPALKNIDLVEGIRQAIQYSAYKG
ncbi:hypothetical protein, partial [Pseudomonas sp. 100_A]|uniref:hypothetical protein n=1 Tax=Pseudomonas sp. 100_A TaxID=2813571 RepID=UPI001FAEA6DD